MKFEYDNRTGGMVMKKNPQIYFSRSMSGGLRVDDQINKTKYIIERDGTVKFISGVEKDVNIYDQRMAHTIADRVKRMFGSGHKYSNYKMFTEGYHVIKDYDDFVNELWSRGVERNVNKEIRREDGIKVNLPDEIGYVILNDKGCGLPYKLDTQNGDDLYYYYVENEDMYLFGYEDDGDYTYFIYDPDNEDEGFLTQIATSDYDMVDDEFILIRAMRDYDSDYLDMEFKDYDKYYICNVYDREFYLFDDYDNVKEFAYDNEKDIIEGSGIDSDSIKRWMDYFGNDFIDVDRLEEWRHDDYENYVNDIENEDGELGCRLYDEMKEHGLIDDTDEYFERIVDEDDEEDEGSLDYSSPIFDIDEKKSELVDKLCDNYDDVVEWYIDNFGSDNLSEYVDIDKLVEMIIDSDGPANSIAYYDGNEYNFSEDDYDIYIYRRN